MNPSHFGNKCEAEGGSIHLLQVRKCNNVALMCCLQLLKAAWTVQDVDLFELNEAFAAQSLAVIKELNCDANKVMSASHIIHCVVTGIVLPDVIRLFAVSLSSFYNSCLLTRFAVDRLHVTVCVLI